MSKAKRKKFTNQFKQAFVPMFIVLGLAACSSSSTGRQPGSTGGTTGSTGGTTGSTGGHTAAIRAGRPP